MMLLKAIRLINIHLNYCLMIDDIKLDISLDISEELNVFISKVYDLHGILFYPVLNTKTGQVKYWESTYENLKLRLTNDSLVVLNSWHKFFKGNNYSDYSLSQIIETYKDISEILDIDILNATVKKISYGLVVNTPADINYNNWSFYKSKPPTPMMKGSKQYGAKFYFTDFNIKGYDKKMELKLHSGIIVEQEMFRFEVEVKYMKHLLKRKKPVNIYTVADVLDYENIQYLMNDLLTKYSTIEKLPFYNFTQLNKQDRLIVSMLSFAQARTFLQKKENHTYKRYKTKLKLIKRLSDEEYHHTTLRLLNDKATQLLNS